MGCLLDKPCKSEREAAEVQCSALSVFVAVQCHTALHFQSDACHCCEKANVKIFYLRNK
jgi:hypothetical protein